MVVFPNCKINIGLNICSKRADGYHNLETVFFPLPIYDVLELTDAPKTDITILGNTLNITIEENIVYKAWELLAKDFQKVKPIHFHLLKNIPSGAGLGAGSANGAYTLMALNKKFDLNLSEQALIDYALKLGSDCPFFIKNKPVFASGRGEVFEDIHLNLSGYQLVLINPGIHISTPWAFKHITPQLPTASLKQLIRQPINIWRKTIVNDFEHPVFNVHPQIKHLKEQLYELGASFAGMSGSGSTVYALFANEFASGLHFPFDYYIKTITL